MYDTHVHSKFSPDGISTIEEYVLLIDNKKVSGIGFTEHLDFMPECGAYGFHDYESYINTINSYRSRGYEFFAGAEVDYAKRVEPDIKACLKQNHYDYTICSVHMIDGVSVSDGKNTGRFRDTGTFRKMLEKYYYEVEASLRCKLFDVIGHINIYGRYLTDEFFNDEALKRWLREANDQLARACALSNKIIEVNSSGLFSPSRSTCPGPDFLKRYFEYGGRMISVGSDAHRAEHVGRGFGDVKEMLRDIGFEYIFLPWDRDKGVRL